MKTTISLFLALLIGINAIATDYTKGVFIINEEGAAGQNSTINFLGDNGQWTYRVVQTENPGAQLGASASSGTIYGDKFYIISKQDIALNGTDQGAKITILDAKTMKIEKQIRHIVTDNNGNSVADGRSFIGIDENKGYIGTSNGIYPFNLNTYEIGDIIAGTENSAAPGTYESLYYMQIGSMIRVNDKVFAVHQDQGVHIINPYTDKIEQTIKLTELGDWSFGTIVLSKDGNLWLSVAKSDGSADNRIVKLNPNTLESEIIQLPEGVYGPANSWYAWTPDCFCASKQNNVLYWNGGETSWASNQIIFKYDIESGEVSKYIDLTGDVDGWMIYGSSFRIDPISDNAVVSMFKSWTDKTYIVRKYDNSGNIIAEYPMEEGNLWYPAIPVFPDNEMPKIETIGNINISDSQSQTAPIVATDADNMDAAIIKNIKSNSNSSIANAEIINGELAVTPLNDGTTTITIQINSNGKFAETSVIVTVSGFDSISDIECDNVYETARFNIEGKLLTAPQSGINIIRLSNGSVRKEIVK